jgi:hypothetical protein
VRTWKKAIVACFGKLSKNLPAEKGETLLEEKDDNFSDFRTQYLTYVIVQYILHTKAKGFE